MKSKLLFGALFLLLLVFACTKDENSGGSTTEASVSALNCSSVSFSATATANTVYSGTASVPYTGGNGGSYSSG